MKYAYNTDLLTHQYTYTSNNSECLTDELYGDFTVEKYNNLIERRKFVRARMQNQLYRNQTETLFIPIVFHNVYQISNGNPTNSFCDYQVDSDQYENNNDNTLCQQRAETVLEILNEQFAPENIIFIPPPDTSLIVEDTEDSFDYISTDNSSDIREHYNIPRVLNVYLIDCIRKYNGDCNIGKRGFTIPPDKLSNSQKQGIVLIHSCVPGINDDRIGTLAHEIGHVFTLLHLYHWPEININIPPDSTDWIKDPEFNRELVNGSNCEFRGDAICDTPGQPIFSVIEAFDTDNCIYHGFGGEFNLDSHIIKIGGSSKFGSFETSYDTTTNLIATSNQDEEWNFWGTRGLPDSCFLIDQNEFSTECPDSLYKYLNYSGLFVSALPSATNFLQIPNINDQCLRREHIGFSPEQFANIRISLEHDYTACSEENACNTGYSTRSNISPSDLFLTGNSSCRFPCATDGGCLITDLDYQTDFSQYDCYGNYLTENQKTIPQNFGIHHIYPNPLNPITTIDYVLNQNVNIQISIYDINGRLINTLINEFQISGYHTTTWDASNFASGIYFLNISSGKIAETKKMVLIK